MLRLIGLDGDKGAGKDTIAEVLIRHFGFVKVPFAKPLKDILSSIFLIAPITFEDRTLKERLFTNPIELTTYHIQRILDELELRGVHISDTAIKACLAMHGKKLYSPRELMQFIGTEMVRTHIGYDTWVNLWSKEQARYSKVIAPDARFANERDAVSVRSGKNVLVKRPSLINTDSHASENNHGLDSDYDAIVNNVVSKVQIQSEFGLWYTTVSDK